LKAESRVQQVPDGKPRRSFRARAAHAVARFFYSLFHHVWSLLILVACILIYLWAVGLPAPVTRALVGRIDTGSFRTEIDRIRIDFTEGLVGENVRFYEADRRQPLFSAAVVGLNLDWSALLRRKQPLEVIHVMGGTITWPDELEKRPLRLTNMSAVIRFERDAVRFPELVVDVFGVPLVGRGEVMLDERPQQATDPWAELERLLAGARKSPAWLQELSRVLDGARHEERPRGRVDFTLYPGSPESNAVAIAATGAGARLRGAHLDGWDVEVLYRQRVVSVSNLALRVGANTLHVGAVCDLAGKTVAGRLFSDVPPSPVLKLVPRRYRESLERLGIDVRGAFKAELWTGPVPFGQVARSFAGWVSVQDAELKGVPFINGFASFKREGDLLSFTSIKGTIGRGERAGPLSASATWDAATGEVEGSIDLTCFPDDAIPAMSPAQASVTRRFVFGNVPAQFKGTFRESRREPNGFRLDGRLVMEDVAYHGQALTSVDTTIAFRDQVLRLEPFLFARPEGDVQGSLVLNFETDVYDVDLRSTIDPRAVVRIVGPGLTRALSFLEFNGPAKVHAFGRVDGKEDKETDLRVDVAGEDVKLEWFEVDTCTVGVDCRAGTYVITNLAGTAYGGTFWGLVDVRGDTNGVDMRHTIDITLTNAQFSMLTRAFHNGGTNGNTGGLLFATLQASGLANSGALETLTGTGRVHIREGELLSMRLFGGLSRLLSAIYPGLGFASQNDFKSDFAIDGNKVHMKNAFLGGSVLSVRAAGYYDFSGKLRFTVEVQPLRAGPIAAVLRLFTFPVTKLLKFDLGGTLEHPTWRPSNLPKELFLIFD
jgi:hypothetical protein